MKSVLCLDTKLIVRPKNLGLLALKFIFRPKYFGPTLVGILEVLSCLPSAHSLFLFLKLTYFVSFYILTQPTTSNQSVDVDM